MARLGVTIGLGVMGLAALVQGACSEETQGPPKVETVAGQAGSPEIAGGRGGGGGAAGGMGGAVGGDGGRSDGGGAACEQRDVSAYCDALLARLHPETCPENPDDFDREQKCGPYNGVDRYASECGGEVVRVWGDKMDGFSFYSTDFTFDAEGKLIGVTSTTDIATQCPDDWGTPCARTGEATSLCGDGGAGGAGGQAGAGAQAGTGG